MHINDKLKNKQYKNPVPKGACLISFTNGHKECAVDMTASGCADLCDKDPGANCELSSENKCPRGT